ncbi:hypothetical protein ACFVZ8_09825, partial [Streptomyces sp. NPDC059558]|uniref:hypothetical protein n=1 Tax=Streptomyces sp. NPDC059558 TaxID=3346864 RepID=UPI003699C418
MSEHTSTPRNAPRDSSRSGPVGRRGFLAGAAAVAAAAATPAQGGAPSAAPAARAAAPPYIQLFVSD